MEIKDQLLLNKLKKSVAKVAKTYLGNVKVVWTNGDNVAAAPRTDQPQQAQPVAQPADDLPF